jgi:hypothetical protein
MQSSRARTPLGPQPSTFTLRRVLSGWGEGNKWLGNLGQPAEDGEASWNNRFHPSAAWGNPGGAVDVDFSSVVSSSSFVSGIATNLFETSSELVADVQHWLLNPSQNFGWMLLSESEATGSTARRFGSRESVTNAPVLEVEYALPFRLGSVGLVGATFRFSFPVEPLFSYTVESRASLSSGTWNLLTNFTETAREYEATITDAAGGPRRFYRVLRAPCNCQ